MKMLEQLEKDHKLSFAVKRVRPRGGSRIDLKGRHTIHNILGVVNY